MITQSVFTTDSFLPRLYLHPFCSLFQIYQDVKHRNRRQMSLSRHSATATQQARRKQEDNLAIVFMGIVLIFLLCHSPRIVLSIFEMIVIRQAMACDAIQEPPFPLWALVLSSVRWVQYQTDKWCKHKTWAEGVPS